MAIKLTDKQIQDGWRMVKFAEIAKNISQRVEPSETNLNVYVGLEHLDPQSLRITHRGVPSDVQGQKLRVRPGQIIFGKRRAYQKKVAVADFDGICSAHAMVLEAIPGKIIPELLPFFMQSDMFMDRAVAISEGSLSPTIKWKTLAIQQFPLPSLDRQEKILEVLQKVEEVYSLAEDSLASGIKAKDVSAVHFYDGKKNLKLIQKTLGKLSYKIQDGTHFSPKTQSKGYKYITSKNIKFGYLDIDDIEYISREEHENIYKRCDVKKNDILLTKDGANTGNVCINPLVEEFSLLSSVAFIRPNQELNNSYLFHYLLSPICQRNIKSSMAGNAITRLTLTKIKAMQIPVCPLQDQEGIGEMLDIFKQIIETHIQKIDALLLTRNKIFTQFFNEVKQ